MKGRRSLSLEKAEALFAYSALIPILLYMIVFVIFPIVVSILYSFMNSRNKFIGLDNYFEFLFEDPRGVKSFLNIFEYSLIRIPATVIPGFFIANAMNNIKKGRSLLIAGFFAPYITSMVAYSTIFLYLYSNLGLLNFLLRALGLPAQGFLRNVKQALPAIALADALKHIGFDIIIFLAAFQSIPDVLYEAAIIDGASARQVLFRIKIPLLQPTFLYLFVVLTIWTFQVFESVYVMSGPLNSTRTVVFTAYQAAFRDGRLGYGSAITILLFILIFFITMIQLRLGRNRWTY
jgi:multiple sugar transport system permease protein